MARRLSNASVEIRTFWNDDEIRTEGARLGDSLIEMYSSTRSEMIDDLKHLSRVIAGSYDDFEGGTIVVVRQRRRTEKS